LLLRGEGREEFANWLCKLFLRGEGRKEFASWLCKLFLRGEGREENCLDAAKRGMRAIDLNSTRRVSFEVALIRLIGFGSDE
jgi:hypothetical protein